LFPDTIGRGDFIGKHLQAGQLFVGLLDLPLEVVVAFPQDLGFLLQGIVVRHFPGHAGVTAHDAEQHQHRYAESAERRVNEPMRNVYSLQAPMKRMGQHYDKVILIQSVSSWRKLQGCKPK
jgi:hypothetical protein